MNIHEYQAKEIFRKYGIPTNDGGLAKTAEEAEKYASEHTAEGLVFAVKAQVHAGGRGKAGGIKIVKNSAEVKKAASEILGQTLRTKQTGEAGLPIDSVLIEVTKKLVKEFYVSVVLDRTAFKPCFIVSEAGGMDIEEVAESQPEKIHRELFSLEEGLSDAQADSLAAHFAEGHEDKKAFSSIFKAVARIFVELDASLIEINPLGVLEDGTIVAIDAKINFDDNALFRHEEIAALRDPRQEDSREVEAKKFDLSYVGLDGNIGCIVNGAGLAMATMDIIKYAGGEPANFLDVGGGASKEKVAAAFKIILQDPKVKAILVNIFGGIMRCDVVAEGILAAVQDVGVNVPLVVRLEGTNVKEGKEILAKSDLKIHSASTFKEAAEKAVSVL